MAVTTSTDREDLEELVAHLGMRALSWLLNTDPADAASRIEGGAAATLSTAAEDVLGQLAMIDAGLRAQPQTQVDAEARARLQLPDWIGEQWRFLLAKRHTTAEESVGNVCRRLSGGDLPVLPEDLPALDELLARMAIEAYPAFLVGPGWEGTTSRISLHSHPLNEQFQELALADPILGALFPNTSEQSGRWGKTLRSSGTGGGQQLWTFADTLVAAGWRLARALSGDPSGDELVAAVLQSFSTVKQATAGTPATVPARVGLAGVLLPRGVDSLEFGWGRLRRMDQRDEQFIRATRLQGQLTIAGPDGNNIAINYSGDLVLELEVPYKVLIRDAESTDVWPESLKEGGETLATAIENVRLALLLAVSEKRVIAAPSWQTMLDPLTQGAGAAWWDVPSTPGLVPTQITEEEAGAWQEWTQRVAQLRIPGIAIAIRRLLAATSERRSPDDVLVDAVIVWENLFGARTETTLRVTSALAWLLGTSPTDRLPGRPTSSGSTEPAATSCTARQS